MRQDSNLRHLVLETSALTGLSYAPKHPPQHTGVQDGRYLFTILGDRQKVSPTSIDSIGGLNHANVKKLGVGESPRGTARATPDNVSPTGLEPVPPP